MILTGEEILWNPVQVRARHLARITELVRLLRPDCPALSLQRLAAANELGRSVFYCVEDTVVGCAQLINYPGLAMWMPTLENVVVHPDYRQRGIGRLLVEHLIKYAKNRKYSRIALLTEPENAAARAFYKSLGFQEVVNIRGRLPL